jgi:hypothetical protein
MDWWKDEKTQRLVDMGYNMGNGLRLGVNTESPEEGIHISLVSSHITEAKTEEEEEGEGIGTIIPITEKDGLIAYFQGVIKMLEALPDSDEED